MADISNKPVLKDARKRTKSASGVILFDQNETPFGNGRFYQIRTYGCQGNEADSEKIHGLLDMAGFVETNDEEVADVIIVNTCAIRANAENKVFGEIGRMKHLKIRKKELIIAVGGCMSQEEVVVEKLLKTHRHVDIIFGTHNLHRLLEYLRKVMEEKVKVVEVYSVEGNLVEHVPATRDHRYKAWVNIMYGCDEFCTYCIVPYTRGKERSRRKEHILEEVDELISQEYKEITLLGQNVNSYGLDFQDDEYSFANLLQDLSKKKIDRIRFTTSHPKDFSDEMIEAMATSQNVMPFLHLPVQSGSNKILKAMNRKYTKEEYLELIRKIKEQIPGISITTDIIVGFPGETEADFEETLDLFAKCDFEGAYTFIFSKRSGTPAASYEDDTPMDVKKQRLYRLNDLVNAGFLKGNRRFDGQIVQVLIEGPSKTNEKMMSGYTEHAKLVNLEAPSILVGQIVPVRITNVKTWSLSGEIVNEQV